MTDIYSRLRKLERLTSVSAVYMAQAIGVDGDMVGKVYDTCGSITTLPFAFV